MGKGLFYLKEYAVAECLFCRHTYVKARRNKKYCSMSCICKAYYRTHKKQIKEMHTHYRKTHKEAVKKWSETYREKHHAEYNAYQKAYYHRKKAL